MERLSLNAAIGSSINTTKVNSLSLDSGKSGLYKANVFTVPNMNLSGAGTSYIDETANQRRTIQSVFATAQLGWKESIYLDVTARNDWSSTLANTKSENSGFFYPSVGLSWILNKTLNLPEWISFGKVRASGHKSATTPHRHHQPGADHHGRRRSETHRLLLCRRFETGNQQLHRSRY